VRESEKGPKPAKNVFSWFKKLPKTAKWLSALGTISTIIVTLASLDQLHWWPFSQPKESPNPPVATNNGSIERIYGPVQQYFYNGVASPSPQSSPPAPSQTISHLEPTPTATPSQTIIETPAPTATPLRHEGQDSDLASMFDLDKSFSDGLKAVLRAASEDFSDLCEDRVLENTTKGFVRKGTFVFGGASFAECQKEGVDSENVWFSYTVFYGPCLRRRL
jgi:hypothetical protein